MYATDVFAVRGRTQMVPPAYYFSYHICQKFVLTPADRVVARMLICFGILHSGYCILREPFAQKGSAIVLKTKYAIWLEARPESLIQGTACVIQSLCMSRPLGNRYAEVGLRLHSQPQSEQRGWMRADQSKASQSLALAPALQSSSR